ncbi:MAG: ABC transporter permease [Planctomycetales bacterium]|nr:ABC transporter permease [Planctomycetales bacterium]
MSSASDKSNAGGTDETVVPQPPAARAWRRFRRSVSAWVGLAIVSLFVGVAITADWIAPYDPSQRHAEVTSPSPPSAAHWLGTDSGEKDTLSRVIHGSRLSLLSGLISIVLAIGIGVPWGTVAGYYGGWRDALLMRTIDVALAFPSILIALLVATAYRPGWSAVMIAVGLINVPVFARQSRATVLTVRELEYVLASRAFGATSVRIVWREIVPALVSPIVVLATLGLGAAILEVAGLSFLGVGGDPTEPEWGTMLAVAKDHLSQSLWPALGPGIAISLVILGFNLLGDGLRDALDPGVRPMSRKRRRAEAPKARP